MPEFMILVLKHHNAHSLRDTNLACSRGDEPMIIWPDLPLDVAQCCSFMLCSAHCLAVSTPGLSGVPKPTCFTPEHSGHNLVAITKT